MVAREDGVGQFAVEGNFELNAAVLEGLQSLLNYSKKESALMS